MISQAPRRFAVVASLAAALAAVDGTFARADDEKPKQNETAEAESLTPDWDQVATIRGAAERLGRLHRAKGAKAAYDLIDACYRTHSLSSTYGEGFEICIVQDYLETRTLVQVYARMPAEALQKMGVPSPEQLADSMRMRVASAFTKYGKSEAYAENLRKLVDQHGAPVFLGLVFPESSQDGNAQQKSKRK